MGRSTFAGTYSYKVYARLQSGTNEILSAPSPLASATSLPFVQVSGLTYTVTPSTKTLGRLDIIVRWNEVKDVEKYVVWDETFALGLAAPPGTPSGRCRWA